MYRKFRNNHLISMLFQIKGNPKACLLTAFALVMPRRDSLGALFIDKEDRARVMSLIFVIMLAVSSPFGSLIGWLSSINRQLPFILNIIIFAVIVLIVSTSKAIEQHDSSEFED